MAQELQNGRLVPFSADNCDTSLCNKKIHWGTVIEKDTWIPLAGVETHITEYFTEHNLWGYLSANPEIVNTMTVMEFLNNSSVEGHVILSKVGNLRIRLDEERFAEIFGLDYKNGAEIMLKVPEAEIHEMFDQKKRPDLEEWSKSLVSRPRTHFNRGYNNLAFILIRDLEGKVGDMSGLTLERLNLMHKVHTNTKFDWCSFIFGKWKEAIKRFSMVKDGESKAYPKVGTGFGFRILFMLKDFKVAVEGKKLDKAKFFGKVDNLGPRTGGVERVRTKKTQSPKKKKLNVGATSKRVRDGDSEKIISANEGEGVRTRRRLRREKEREIEPSSERLGREREYAETEQPDEVEQQRSLEAEIPVNEDNIFKILRYLNACKEKLLLWFNWRMIKMEDLVQCFRSNPGKMDEVSDLEKWMLEFVGVGFNDIPTMLSLGAIEYMIAGKYEELLGKLLAGECVVEVAEFESEEEDVEIDELNLSEEEEDIERQEDEVVAPNAEHNLSGETIVVSEEVPLVKSGATEKISDSDEEVESKGPAATAEELVADRVGESQNRRRVRETATKFLACKRRRTAKPASNPQQLSKEIKLLRTDFATMQGISSKQFAKFQKQFHYRLSALEKKIEQLYKVEQKDFSKEITKLRREMLMRFEQTVQKTEFEKFLKRLEEVEEFQTAETKIFWEQQAAILELRREVEELSSQILG